MSFYLCVKTYQAEAHLIEHFIDYYQKLGIDGIIAVFSYFSKELEEGFEKFVEAITKKYSINYINAGYLNSDNSATKILKNLAKNSDADYIIPADTDEFHEYPFGSLKETAKYMQEKQLSYLSGHTIERISKDGTCIPVVADLNIFDQFPNYNQNLFVMPKISILDKETYLLSGCGHHYIDNKYNRTSEKITKTHHFRWSEQNKTITQNWVKIYKDRNFEGWKSVELAEKRLCAFDSNLAEYGKIK